MQEEKQEKLPLDAKLLSDAVIELNISRRSVGLYPPEHPIVRTAMKRAFNHLQKLFEIRDSITLGVAKDTLVVDEYILDRKNPVFREFARTLHGKGIAAVTFSVGLQQTELTRLHEFITAKDLPMGRDLAELAAKEIVHITLSPIDFTSFCFVEGVQRSGNVCGDIWEDYVYGLLEGKLADEEAATKILSLSPNMVADVVNAAMTEESSQESYDRVITAYIRKKGEARISREALGMFISFVDRLRPEIKRQFLSRSGERLSEDIGNLESIISGMTPESLEKIAGLFTEHASLIPNTLKNLIDKLASVKQTNKSYFDFFYHETAVLHDIELGDAVIKLFGDDNFHAYVSKEYQKELERMLSARGDFNVAFVPFQKECDEEVIETIDLEIMLELLHADFLTAEDYLAIITKLSDFMTIFIETGRFEQVLETYNTLSSHALSGKFINEASSIVEYFFHSEEFIAKLVDALILWGRKDRDGAIRLTRALRKSIINPLFAALEKEADPSMRKFLLSALEAIGSDVIPHAVSRLSDNRWFVIRNMIYLIRECNGKKEIEKIRKLIRHDNASVRMEALKTLLHFKTPDAVSQLRAFLRSEDAEIRKGAVRQAGFYKVQEVVPDLLPFLEKRDLFGTGAFYKGDIVRALGEIGDSRAVGVLQKIYNASALFYKGNLEELKIEIFKSLDKYPPDATRPLLEKGLSSKIEEIRALSEKHLMSYHTAKKTRK